MKVEFAAAASGTGAIAAPVYDDAELSAAAAELDAATSGAVKRAIAASRFSGKPAQTLEIVAPAGVEASRIVLFGLGAKDKRTASTLEKAGAAVVQKLLTGGETAVTFALAGETDAEGAARTGLGARLAAYRYDQYRTKLKDDQKPSLASVTITAGDVDAANAAWASWGAVADGVDGGGCAVPAERYEHVAVGVDDFVAACGELADMRRRLRLRLRLGLRLWLRFRFGNDDGRRCRRAVA